MQKTNLPESSDITHHPHIQINPLEELVNNTSTISCNGEKDVFILLMVISGTGNGIINGRNIILQHNSIYPGYADSFQKIIIHKETKGYYIAFSPAKIQIGNEICDNFLEDISIINQRTIQLNADTIEDVSWLTSRLTNNINNAHTHNHRLANKYLTLLLLLVRSQSDISTNQVPMNSKGVLLKNFFFLLEKNYAHYKTVERYADMLCISPKYLTNVIKSESGYPTSWHINKRIILEATKMVKHSGATMKEIAYSLGFEDMATFSKLFKRTTGITFKQYKCNQKIEVSQLLPNIVEW